MRYTPWKTWEAVLGVGLLALVTLAIVLPVSLAMGRGDWSTGLRLGVASGMLGVFMLAIPLLMGPVRHRASIATLGLGRLPSAASHLLLLPLLVLGASLVFNSIYVSLVARSGLEVLKLPSLPSGLGFHGNALMVGFLLIALWGPLSEEVFFRGYVFAGSVDRLGPLGAAFFSAILFALFHGVAGLLIPAFFTGLLLAWLYYRTRSLWTSFTAHAAQNSLAFLAITNT